MHLNGGEDLIHVLNRLEKAGGRILQQKTDLGENGFLLILKIRKAIKLACARWVEGSNLLIYDEELFVF